MAQPDRAQAPMMETARAAALMLLTFLLFFLCLLRPVMFFILRGADALFGSCLVISKGLLFEFLIEALLFACFNGLVFKPLYSHP